jgi:hypothetical protein
LLGRAVPLGDGRHCLLRDLAGFGYRGSLLRAVGHWIRTAAGLSALETWLWEGPAGLVQPDTRLIPVAPILPPVGKTGDLVVHDRRLREGDWIVALAEPDGRRIQALARINGVVRRGGRNSAFSSIYWYFKGGGRVVDRTMSRAIARERSISDPPLIRHLVAQVDSHYRIGLHQPEPMAAAPA